MQQVAYRERTGYPVEFSVDYPDRPLNRLNTAFRTILVIPIAILLSTLSGGVLYFAPLLMILFRSKYPRWWFDWNLELQRFTNRIGIYLSLMDDRYPATDDHQSVHLDYSYPEHLNRWLPLVKWFLAIPHYVVLFFLDLASFFVVIVAWFAILVTGRYPRGIFGFVEGVIRWNVRVTAYTLTLVTDRYPPFRLAPNRCFETGDQAPLTAWPGTAGRGPTSASR
jgi:hypothetical protein